MTVFVSKFLWAAVQPVSLVVLLVGVGLTLTFTRYVRAARVFLGSAALILAVLAFTSAGYLVLEPLEDRFRPPATLPATVDGIIVLGGGMDARVNEARGGYEFNRSGDRFVAALRLALLYPEAQIVISGGSDLLGPHDDTEAEAGARFFEAFGVPRARMILEDASRTTTENAVMSQERITPRPGETWLLVTSAFHMPRAVGVFRKTGFDVVPWPADYLSSGRESMGIRLFRPAENLAIATLAIREWLALLGYWVTGRIDALPPGPKD